MKQIQYCLAFALFLLTGTPQAGAQATLLRKPIAEILEYFAKKGGREAVKELEELGGERVVREIIERATAQGGEELAQQVVGLAQKQGGRALAAIRADPATMVKALNAIPETELAGALTEAARHPELMAALIRTHGAKALLAATRHPGVGLRVIDGFGKSGIKAAQQLKTDELLVLGRVKGFDKLPEGARKKFTNLLDQHPRRVVNALLLVGGGTAMVLTLEKANRVANMVVGDEEHPGKVLVYVWIVGGVLVAALVAYASIKLWGVWVVTRKRAAKR